MYNFVEQIYLSEEKCVGCNKCLSNCPIPGANIAYIIDGNNKVKVNTQKCIHCGECIQVCDHNARNFKDDTERFFEDLSSDKKISIISAPAIRTNFHQYKRLLSYLKKIGVNLIYDASFGADISVWGYTKVLNQGNIKTMIAAPCPSIVNYIQKYEPELIDKLAPVHSPMMCTAIYMKKYANISDNIAFLSPCIAKNDEINDKNSGGYIEYNVTFKKLVDYLKANNIDLNQYEECDFDGIGCDTGFLFSRPGGLKENIELYMDDAWIRQINGPHHAYDYLHNYSNNIKQNKKVPLIVDILNCSYGCNLGTASCDNCKEKIDIDEIDYKFNQLKKVKTKDKCINSNNKKTDSIHEFFNKNLNFEDFKRVYDNNVIMDHLIEPSDTEYDEIFINMNKFTEESRNINCSACGYRSCKTMAKCIYNGLNLLSNCIDYNKKAVINEHNLLETRSEFFTNISHELKTPLNVIYSVLQLQRSYGSDLTLENIENHSKVIKQNCSRLIRLVNNIVDLSRIEAGFFKPIFKVENIVNEVENITLSIASYVENKKMNLIFDTEIEEIYVKCDSNLIERIMLNLLSNSVKYGKEGGNIKVHIYKTKRNNVIISVKDDGIGIPEEMQKKIFDRFQKVDKGLSRNNEGSGIGLSLVKSLVEVQGGTIICRSEINKGSEFLIHFPIINEDDQQLVNMKKEIIYEKNSNETINIEFSDIYL